MTTVHPGGRPTIYSEDMPGRLAAYLATTGREQTSLPTVEGFSQYLGINGDTLVEWAKEHKEFSAAIKELKQAQRHQLMEDGLYGGKEVNAAMAIFLLKANHNMVETSRTEHTGEVNIRPILGGSTQNQIEDVHTDNSD